MANGTLIDLDQMAEAMNESDTRLTLKGFEDDMKRAYDAGDVEGVRNLTNPIHILRAHLELLEAQHRQQKQSQPPSTPDPPEPPSRIPRYAQESLEPHPILDAVDNMVVRPVEHALGADIPLPPEAYHNTGGPNPAAVFWNALRTTHPDPLSVIRAIWRVTVTTFEWVVWDFREFVRLFRAWDGTAGMLLGHPQYLLDLVWRTAVSALIVIGAAEIGPILVLVTEWGRLVVEAIVGAFHLGLDAIRSIRRQVERLHS